MTLPACLPKTTPPPRRASRHTLTHTKTNHTYPSVHPFQIYTNCGDALEVGSQTSDDMDVDDGAADADGLTAKVLGIVEKMFLRCYAERTWTHALGIALEARNLDRVKEILDKCGDSMPEKLSTLQYGLESCTTVVVSRKFRQEALGVIAENFRGMPEEFSDYSSLVRCEHLLGNR